MKTKRQILEWLNKQPWKGEFYEAMFFDKASREVYDKNFLRYSFYWGDTAQGSITWAKRDKEYREWYNSNKNSNVPRSWEEYCKQNCIQETDCFITDNCQILPMSAKCARIPDSGVNVMPKEHCEAFVAYMKLFQLRNAWVKDENLDDSPVTYRILYQDNMFDVFQGHTSTGLSFLDKEEAKEFMVAFKDLLNIAKPLL